MADRPPASLLPIRTGLACRCPACGRGPLFRGFLAVADRCAACGAELGGYEQGDGPAVFVIMILGFLVVGAALAAEILFAPPLWVHAVIWPPVILVGALVMLRPLKGVMVALHYRHRKGDVERG